MQQRRETARGVALLAWEAVITIKQPRRPCYSTWSSSSRSPTGLPTTARTFVKGDVITVGAEIGLRRDFKQGAVHLTVLPQTAAKDAPPVLTRTVELADRAAGEQPRAFAIDTTALGPGQFVLRLTVRDQEDRSAETAVLFEVVEQVPGDIR